MTFVKKNLCLFDVRQGRKGTVLCGDRVHFDGFRNAPQYRAMKMFNEMPRELRDELCPSSFKCKLKSYLIDKTPYSVADVFMYFNC